MILNSETFEKIRSGIISRLKEGLSPDLYYHCLEHTLDVERQAERIALSEGISEAEDILLLRIACLFHDAGFMVAYAEHEREGCAIAEMALSAFGLSPEQLAKVQGMIMATKIPQTPHNKLEEIICDADLDYLGRDDFGPISDQLFEELKVRGLVPDKKVWDGIQIRFFQQHSYFTETTRKLRMEKKALHLQGIITRLESE